jgi:two-component system, sensor histidine kinase YesM
MKYLNKVALKISSLYFLIVGLAIVFLGIIAMEASQKAVLRQFEYQQQRIVQSIEANINLRINQHAYRLDNITLDSRVNKVLRNEATETDALRMVANLDAIGSGVDAVHTIRLYGSLFADGLGDGRLAVAAYVFPEELIQGEPWYRNLLEQKSRMSIQYDDSGDGSLIRLSAVIMDDRYGAYTDKLGVVVFEIDPSDLISAIDPAIIIGLKEFYIVDDQDHVIFSNMKETIGSDLEMESLRHDKEIFFERELQFYGWKFVGQGDLASLHRSTDYIQRILVFIVLSSILVFFIITMPFSKSLYARIANINANIHQLGYKKVVFARQRKIPDELSDIELKVLETERQIHVMVDDLKRQLQEEEDLKLKFLNSQVNQLLLNTTLSNINWMALSEGIAELSELSNLMAEFYRNALCCDDHSIQLQDELNQIDSYMKIIEIIYPGKIAYSCDLGVRSREAMTTKFILQPIFENAIIHGILPKSEQGHIHLQASVMDSFLIITVQDDGVGCDPAILVDGATHGVGLSSVNQRIQLTFGKEYGVSISRGPGFGTVVTIRQPWCVLGQEDAAKN